MKPLTLKQAEAFRFIGEFIAERGIAPTFDEIALHLSVTKAVVYEHLRQLEEKGAIRRDKYRRRSIEVLGTIPKPRPPRTSIPVRGHLTPGNPIAETEDVLDLSDILDSEDRFALRIRGEDLAASLIADGDYLILEHREAREGETVLTVLEDQTATLTKLRRAGDRVRLLSLDGTQELSNPMAANIRGAVVGTFRRLEIEAPATPAFKSGSVWQPMLTSDENPRPATENHEAAGREERRTMRRSSGHGRMAP